MKKLPKSVMVGGYNLKIEIVDRVDKENSYGMISLDKGLILIKSGLGSSEWQVFFHEILHAIDQVYNRDTLSEKSIDQISHGLYQVVAQLGWIKDK